MMGSNVHEISNAVMIDSLDIIIQQENEKLENDKNTGLLAQKSKLLKVQQLSNEKKIITTQNIPILKELKSYSSKLNHSCNRINEIERLANLFTQSSGYFTTNNNDNTIDVKDNKITSKEKKAIQTHNELDNYKFILNNRNIKNVFSPNIKVKRNVRIGEYSPLNPANQINSQPFLGLGEYDDKKKKNLELQKKEYIEYLSKAKKEENSSGLPILTSYSCEDAFKTAMDIDLEPVKLSNKNMHNQENAIQLSPFRNGVESCTTDEEKIKETNRLKQELYRLELNKQIEEKRKLELDQKYKEQMEDEAIERTFKEQEEKIKKEFEREAEKRIMAQLQKQLQQEKLKNEIMQKKNDLETKSWNVPIENNCHPVSKYISSRPESLEDYNTEEFHCLSESTFDDTPLPTSRVRVPRKIMYDDEPESQRTKDVLCNTDTFNNPCVNQDISSSIVNQKTKKMETAHVSFAEDISHKKNKHNSTATLPEIKSVIIDSPHTLALAGLNDCKDDETIDVTETVYRNEISKEVLLGNDQNMLSDKHLLSNLGDIRKQLNIEHQKLKQQVRRSQ